MIVKTQRATEDRHTRSAMRKQRRRHMTSEETEEEQE